ncbi:MAG: hypothetical protein ACRCSK_09170 [Fusobacteriaceae bacterium]
MLMLKKNYDYFGSIYIMVEEHGVFFSYKIMLIVLLMMTVNFYLFYASRKMELKYVKKLVIFEFSAYFCGLFGITAFTLCIIPIYLKICLLPFKWRINLNGEK